MKYIKSFTEALNLGPKGGPQHKDFGDYETFRKEWEGGEKNFAPVYKVTTRDNKTEVGTFQHGKGFTANKTGEDMGLKSGLELPKFADGTYPKIQDENDSSEEFD